MFLKLSINWENFPINRSGYLLIGKFSQLIGRAGTHPGGTQYMRARQRCSVGVQFRCLSRDTGNPVSNHPGFLVVFGTRVLEGFAYFLD